MAMQTPFSPLSFGKSFMKIRPAVPENGCLVFCGERKKQKKNICKTYTYLRKLWTEDVLNRTPWLRYWYSNTSLLMPDAQSNNQVMYAVFKYVSFVIRPGSRLKSTWGIGVGSGRFYLGSESNFGGVVWLFSSQFISREYYFCPFCTSVLVHVFRILHLYLLFCHVILMLRTVVGPN